MELRPGDTFLDRYVVSHELGTGAYGTVYKAHQTKLGRDVAIKLLRIDDEIARRRFELEAKIVASLTSPATVSVFDYGTEDDSPYMVLEYIAGRTLRQTIDWRGAFDVERAIQVLLQILRSLSEAHKLGIVHRDLKPGNIIVFQPDGDVALDRVKVLDFGLAKMLISDGRVTHPGKLTQGNMAVGTLRYMSPEQLRGQPLTPATDLFSMGLIVYEMLTGQHPFYPMKDLELIGHLRAPEPIRLPEDAPVPVEFADIVHKMLAKNVNERYVTAEEVIMDLSSLGDVTSELYGMPVVPSFVTDTTGEEISYVSLLAPAVSTSPEKLVDAPHTSTPATSTASRETPAPDARRTPVSSSDLGRIAVAMFLAVAIVAIVALGVLAL